MRAGSTGIEERVRNDARASGLRRADEPSLEAVERRRFELWALSLVVFAGAILVIGLVTFLPASLRPPLLSPTAMRVSVIVLALGFATYVVEKEIHLGRVTQGLIDERVRASALEAHLREFSALASASRAINSTLGLEQVLDVILTSALGLLDATDGSVLLAEDGDELRAVCVRGADLAVGARVRFGWGIQGRVALNRTPLLVERVGEPARDKAHASAGAPPGPRPGTTWSVEREPAGHGPSGTMCLPLFSRAELLGVLTVSRSERSFGDEELGVMTVFAEYAAIAIANANLYDAELRRATELAEANSMRSKFVTMVSHELRGPVESMLGVVAALQSGRLDHELTRQLLESNERQGQRLLEMIDDLLASARLDRPGSPPERPVDLADLVRRVISDLELARPGRRQAHVEIESGADCEVQADPVVLRHVLTSLVDNAERHGAPPVRVTVEHDSGQVTLTVSDEGPGIPTQERARIFERFARSKDEWGHRRMGMGLPIVRDMLVGIGGAIEVTGAPGGGAVLRVTLPHYDDRVKSTHLGTAEASNAS